MQWLSGAAGKATNAFRGTKAAAINTVDNSLVESRLKSMIDEMLNPEGPTAEALAPPDTSPYLHRALRCIELQNQAGGKRRTNKRRNRKSRYSRRN
jgi:hypothetical protein